MRRQLFIPSMPTIGTYPSLCCPLVWVTFLLRRNMALQAVSQSMAPSWLLVALDSRLYFFIEKNTTKTWSGMSGIIGRYFARPNMDSMNRSLTQERQFSTCIREVLARKWQWTDEPWRYQPLSPNISGEATQLSGRRSLSLPQIHISSKLHFDATKFHGQDIFASSYRTIPAAPQLSVCQEGSHMMLLPIK